MKTKKLLISIFIILILGSYISFAEEVSSDVSSDDFQVDFVDPGVTPDSFFYVFKTFYENTKLALTVDPSQKAQYAADLAAEKMAEADAMIQKGDVNSASVATEAAKEKMSIFNNNINNIPSDQADVLVSLEGKVVITTELADKLDAEISDNIDSGKLPDITNQVVDVSNLQNTIDTTQSIVNLKKEETIVVIANKQGVSLTEAKIQVDNKEYDSGVSDLKDAQAERKIIDNTVVLDELKTQKDEAVQSGANIDSSVDNAIQSANIRLIIAEKAADNGDSSKALSQLNSIDQIVIHANNIINPSDEQEKTLSTEALSKFNDPSQVVNDIKDDLQKQDRSYATDFESNKNKIISLDPQTASDIKNQIKQNKNELNTIEKIDTELTTNPVANVAQIVSEKSAEINPNSVVDIKVSTTDSLQTQIDISTTDTSSDDMSSSDTNDAVSTDSETNGSDSTSSLSGQFFLVLKTFMKIFP